MLVTLFVLGALGALATGGGVVRHRTRKRAVRDDRNRAFIEFKTLLQDAGFLLGVWRGWDAKEGYYFSIATGLNMPWKMLRDRRIAFPIDGKICTACGWDLWRLCRPYETDSKWIGHMAAVCSNMRCGRIFKDGDRDVALTHIINREQDLFSALETLRALHEAEAEPVYLEAVKREALRLERAAEPLKALAPPAPDDATEPEAEPPPVPPQKEFID